MHCPNCNNRLNPETLHGETVDRCPGCDGIWLDRGELGAVVEGASPSGSKPRDSDAADVPLTCPKCKREMDLFNYAYDSRVFVNKCASCGGIWLKPGQLQRLAKYRAGTPAVESLAHAMGDELCRGNRWRTARRLLRSRLLSGAVAAAYLIAAVVATGHPESVINLALFLALPIACIWFPDEAGSLTGIFLGFGRPVITQKSPGDAVALAGWLLLLSLMVVMAAIYG